MNWIITASAAIVLVSASPWCTSPTGSSAQEQPAKVELKKLLADLKSPDDHTKLQAMMALTEWGPKAQLAIPDLIAGLQSKNEDFRLREARAFYKMTPAPVFRNCLI